MSWLSTGVNISSIHSETWQARPSTPSACREKSLDVDSVTNTIPLTTDEFAARDTIPMSSQNPGEGMVHGRRERAPTPRRWSWKRWLLRLVLCSLGVFLL